MKEWLEEVVDRIYVYDKDKVKVKVFLEGSIINGDISIESIKEGQTMDINNLPGKAIGEIKLLYDKEIF